MCREVVVRGVHTRRGSNGTDAISRERRSVRGATSVPKLTDAPRASVSYLSLGRPAAAVPASALAVASAAAAGRADAALDDDRADFQPSLGVRTGPAATAAEVSAPTSIAPARALLAHSLRDGVVEVHPFRLRRGLHHRVLRRRVHGVHRFGVHGEERARGLTRDRLSSARGIV
jgi:hypothetical protein